MNNISLHNEILDVLFDAERPVVREYRHGPTGLIFGGSGVAGRLSLDGVAIPWEKWKTEVIQNDKTVEYRMRLTDGGAKLVWRFSLDGAMLRIRLEADAPENRFRTIGGDDMPLVVSNLSGFSYWRMFMRPPDPSVGNKMWATDAMGAVETLAPETSPAPTLYGAIWNDAVCVFADSNYPLFPLTHQKRPDGSYSLSINTFQPCVREKMLPPLEATIGFLSDLNGDGRADVSDYRLWINRSRPSGDPLHYDALSYKIFMHYAPLGIGPRTTLAESETIVRSIARLTDGIPQIIYLVGHQTGGHDGTYPTLDGGVDPEVGDKKQLVQLAKTCKTRYNAVLSSHVNLDDAYRHSKDWDERYVVATGSPVADEPMGHGSVCHTRDTETGAVFRRLEAFLSDFPVEKSLHFDNLRLTNTYGCAGWEDIGVLEELVCGVTPVIEWLKEHDITVTTEGYNGMPIDPSCLVSGFWHHDPPDRMRQILHRRISGGGRGSHFGQHTPYDYGICNSIHFDISAQPLPPDNLPADVKEKYFGWLRFPRVTWTFEENRKAILDCIYLGTLLHHFYNEREMLVWDDVGDGHRVVYAGGVVAEIRLHGPDSLRVICGDMTIADGGDRFIPRSGAVYAYSRDGSDRLWTLPDTLRNRPLAVHLLTETGRKPAVGWKISGNAIHLCLLPGEPVKIEPV